MQRPLPTRGRATQELVHHGVTPEPEVQPVLVLTADQSAGSRRTQLLQLPSQLQPARVQHQCNHRVCPKAVALTAAVQGDLQPVIRLLLLLQCVVPVELQQAV